MLHQGSGELQTVTGVELVRSHHDAREDPYRLGVGLIGAEAMLRLFSEPEANPRAFTALTRFLDAARRRAAAARAPGARPARALVPAQAALALGLPAAPDELCRVRRADATLVGFSPAPAAPSAARARAGRARSRPPASRGSSSCSRARSRTRRRRGSASARARGARGRHRLLRGARRLPAAHALRMRRGSATATSSTTTPRGSTSTPSTAYLGGESYWAPAGRATQDELVTRAARVVGLYHDGARSASRARSLRGGRHRLPRGRLRAGRAPRARTRRRARAARSSSAARYADALAPAHGRTRTSSTRSSGSGPDEKLMERARG